MSNRARNPKLAALAFSALMLVTGNAQAAGRPPVTPDVEQAYLSYFEWVFDVRFTPVEKKQMLAALHKEWASPDETEYRNAKNLVDAYEGLKGVPERDIVATRNLRFSQLWPVLDSHRSKVADVEMMAAAYERDHKILAKGHPPLSEEIADAKAKYLQFTLKEGSNGVVQIDFQPLKAELVKTYSALTPEQQKETVHAMGLWAQVEFDWPAMPEAERNKSRKRWRAQAEQLFPELTKNLPPQADDTAAASDEGKERRMSDIFDTYKKQTDQQEEDAKRAAAATALAPATSSSNPNGMTAEQSKLLAAQKKAMTDNMKTQIISNMMYQQHQTRMSIINNMPGGGQYHWAWTYR